MERIRINCGLIKMEDESPDEQFRKGFYKILKAYRSEDDDI